MSEWQVFQRDVLDVLRQYEGFFDFFERVGSLSDDSRPDCFARVSRDGKKEIWVMDAKNKPEIDEDDIERMEKYISMLKTNPIDVGLEIDEISEYTYRGIFVTSSGAPNIDEYKTVQFSCLHQFLQSELVYTDTDKVVRDVAKMVERKQLSQSQARLLFRSLKPYENRIDSALDTLDRIKNDYSGLQVKKPPLSSFDFKVPVDVVLTHESRERALLFDIPYSWDEVKNVEQKVKEVKKRLDSMDREVFYAAINTFEQVDSEYVLQPEEVEEELMDTLGVVSTERIAEMYMPKIRTEKTYDDNCITVKDTMGLGFKLQVQSKDDIHHVVRAEMPEKAFKRMKESLMNSRKDFGSMKNGVFTQRLEITEDLDVCYSNTSESLDTFRDSVRSVFCSSVNPVLSKKINVSER